MQDPRALLRSLIDPTARGLEIGPSYNPLAPKKLGYRVDILDHVGTADLRAKYATDPSVDASQIEEVDFVWSDKSLSDTIGAAGVYEYIVASHVIEHTPDLLGFLTQCEKLLTPSGRLILAVPDMRRCFDAFRPLTSLGVVLQANLERRTRHSPATAFDHIAYMANLDGRAGWCRQDSGQLETTHNLDFAGKLFDRTVNDSQYHDFHAWVFTPSSFRLLISDLNELGKLTLREADFRLTDGIEFHCVLSKAGVVEKAARSELLRRVRLELMHCPDARCSESTN